MHARATSAEWTPDDVFSVEELGDYGPLTIEVGRDESDGSFLAVESQTVEFGWGMSREEALEDLAKSLRGCHEMLLEHGPQKLGYGLQQHLSFVDSHKLDKSAL